MLIRRREEEESPLELNMTPMIDVIFQLLIFFMCSLHFKSLEGKLVSYLPKDRGLRQAPVDLPQVEVRIRLTYDEATRRTACRVGDRTMKDRDETAATVRKWHEEFRQRLGPDAKIPVKIQADKLVPFQEVVDVLDACREAGVDAEFVPPTGD